MHQVNPLSSLNDSSSFPHLEEWGRSIGSLRFPAQSMKQAVGWNRTVISKDSVLYEKMHQVYSCLIAPRSADEYDVKLKEEVIFPILFSRNVILRWPNKEEFSRIQKKLYILRYSSIFKDIAEKGGTLIYEEDEQDFGLVLEAQSDKNSKIGKLFGAIHYGFEFGECIIRSLKVHHKKCKLRYGALLLAAAVHHAKVHNITKCKLMPTLEGVPLYVSFGFIPEMVLTDTRALTMWEGFSKEQKVSCGKVLVTEIFSLDSAKDSLSYRERFEVALSE